MLLKNHALKYIQSGFSIIPLKPREKNPLIKWARFQKTKPTEKEISTWWSKWPKANIGLITGAVNRLVVFDEDGEKAAKIIKEGGGLPPGPQSVTSKGRHYLFRHPGFSVQNDVNKKLDLDIRGDGGYIVAPPSVHPSGHVYSWVPGISSRTLRSWLKEGLCYTKLPSGMVLVKTDWVDEFLERFKTSDDKLTRIAQSILKDL
jgi:hypothetical protein